MLIEKRPNINLQWPLRQDARKLVPCCLKATFCTIALMSMVATSTLAEETHSVAPPINIDDVYRIELIVFADAYAATRNSSLAAESQPAEQWQYHGSLSYPENLVFLRDVVVPPIADALNTDLLDAELNNVDLINADGFNTTMLQDPQPLPINVSGIKSEARIETIDSTGDSTSDGTSKNVAAESSDLKADLAQDPLEARPAIPPLLLKLEASESGLAQIAKTLQRRSQYRVLFYEAWNQALTDRQQAPAIPLNGGRPYDDFYELSGTVTLSKERFLHITTDLWLSEFEYQKSIAESEPWYAAENQEQQFPTPPTPPKPPPLSNNSADLPEEALLLTQAVPALLGDSPANETPEPAVGFSDESTINAGPQRPDYVVKRTALLQEYRRLRRDEVHYLDHPLFGAIVMISKYEEPLDQADVNE